MNSLLGFSKCHAAEAVYQFVKGQGAGTAPLWYSKQPALHAQLIHLNITAKGQG